MDENSQPGTTPPDDSSEDEGREAVAPRRRRRRAKRHRIRRFVLTVSAVLAILAFVATLISQTAWGEERVRQLAVDALRDELGLDAQLESVDVRWRYLLPSLTVVASGIELGHPTEGHLLEADALTIVPSLSALIQGRLDLHSIEIDRPQIRLRVRDGVIVNLPEFGQSSDGPVEIPFRRLEVREGAVSLDAEPVASGSLQGLSLVLESGGDDLQIELHGSEGSLTHVTGTETLEELAFIGEVVFDEGIRVERAAVRTPHARVEITDAEARLPFEPDVWSGDFAAELDLAHLADTPLAIALPMEGRVALVATLRGELLDDEPRASGTLDLRLLDVVLDHKWGLGPELRVVATLSPESVEITEGSMVQVVGEGGTIGLAGRIGLDADAGFPTHIEADIDMQFANVIEQLGVTPDTPVWWPMRGRGAMDGTLMPFDLEGPIALHNPSFLVTLDAHHARPQERVISAGRHRIRGRWAVDEEAFYFRRLLLETAHSRVQVPIVHLGFDNAFRVEAAGDVDAADIGPLTSFELAGRGPMTVSITGDFDAPRVRGTANLRGFAFDTYGVGDIQTEWELVRDYLAVSFPGMRATKNVTEYEISDFLIDFSEHVEVTGQLRARRLALSDLYDAFHLEGDERITPFQATGRGQAGFRFTHGFPTDGPNGTLDTDLDLEILDADLGGYAFDRGRLQAHWHWLDFTEGVDGGVLALQNFWLRKGDATVQVDGDIDRGRLQLSVAADQIAIEQTEGISESMPELEGSYSVIGTVGGTTSVPRMHLDVEATGIRTGGALLGDARVYVRLTDRSDPWVAEAAEWNEVPADAPCGHARRGLAKGRWRPGPPVRTPDGLVPALETPMAFLVCGEGLGGQVGVDLAMGWTDVTPLRGRIELKGYRLDPFLARVFGTEGVHGEVSGSAEFTGGALSEAGTLAGRVELQTFEMSTVDGSGETSVGVHNDGPVRFDLVRGGVRVRRARFLGDGSRFEITGEVDARGRLDARLDGRVDLAIMDTLSHEVSDSSGQLRFQVGLQGTTDDPTVFGDAEVHDGVLRVAGIPAALRELNGRVRFSERRVIFEDFTGDIAGGRLAIGGSATLRDGSLQRYAFDADVRGATLVPDEGIELGLSTQLRLAWARGDRLPRLTGRIDVERARYRRQVQLSPTLGELYRPRVAEVQRYDPEEDHVAIDLRLVDRRAARVVNNLMDVRIRIDDSDRPFRIVGTDQRWGLVGTLEIPRGTVFFRNTELEVTEGEIRFDDTTRLDPQFDVVAVTEIRRQQSQVNVTTQAWRVRLHAHGNLDGFQLDATSTPSLSQEDLMLLLTVGMTSAEAQQLQAGDVGGTALEALSAISGVNEEVVNALRVIDDFAITTRYSPATGRPEPMLTVGKRITERVRLSASTGLTGQDRTFQTGLEWRVGDQTSLQMVYDNINRESASNFGNVGLDLRWRLEFE